ncbi:MAG: hypothetical protein ACTSXH_04290 [Promethearchaeota archaeon]
MQIKYIALDPKGGFYNKSNNNKEFNKSKDPNNNRFNEESLLRTMLPLKVVIL